MLFFIFNKNKDGKKIEFFQKENFEDTNNLINELSNQKCRLPTFDNPFMNVTMADLLNNTINLEACPINSKEIDKHTYFPEDINDSWNQKYNQRQFYTMPVTTIPNDQSAFAHRLYELPETCKENSAMCLRYEDIRYNRLNPEIDSPEKNTLTGI